MNRIKISRNKKHSCFLQKVRLLHSVFPAWESVCNVKTFARPEMCRVTTQHRVAGLKNKQTSPWTPPESLWSSTAKGAPATGCLTHRVLIRRRGRPPGPAALAYRQYPTVQHQRALTDSKGRNRHAVQASVWFTLSKPIYLAWPWAVNITKQSILKTN